MMVLNTTFRRNSADYGGHNQVIDAKTPQAVVGVEGDDARIDSRCVSPPYVSR